MPMRDREREDLFQEGCLGLIQAAATYPEQSSIPFAAFALPRIHGAVSRALHTKFHLIRTPAQRKRTAKGDVDSEGTVSQPRVHSMSDLQTRRLADRRRHDPGSPSHETVGDRLRGKYERALRQAQGEVAGGASRRGDREQLVRTLVEDRFLIPSDESRTALRQIARQTSSSYARVADCDKQLTVAVRERLCADPEFEQLRQRARHHPRGVGRCVDPSLDRALAITGADAFVTRFRGAEPTQRGRMISGLLDLTGDDLHDALRACVQRLAEGDRERLLHGVRRGESGT